MRPGERSRLLFLVLTSTLLIGYGTLLIAHLGYGVGGSDSSGYANTARGILRGRIVQPIDALDRLGLPDSFDRVFMPLAYSPGPRPRTMAPLYPPGFPLHVAAAVVVGGWAVAPFLVSPLAAVLCLVVAYLLGRELGLSRPYSVAGAAMLGGFSALLYQAVQPMSDVVATLWAMAAILFALRSRRREGWALAAGAALGMAVLVRPSNALLILPMAAALPWRGRTLAYGIAGALPFAGLFAWWDQTAFGGALRTGYAGVLEGELRLSHFVPRLQYYGRSLVTQLSPLVPLGWLLCAADRRIAVRVRLLLVLWFAPLFLFYCFWGPYEIWWYTRYLLPGLPAVILGFLIVLRDLSARLPERGEAAPWRRPRVLAAIAVLLTVAIFERRIERHFRPIGASQGQGIYPDGCRALAGRVEGNEALVVSMEFSGALRFYTDLAPVRWDWVTAEQFAILRARAGERGVRIVALLLPHEIESARPRVPGQWKFLGAVRQATLWELPPVR